MCDAPTHASRAGTLASCGGTWQGVSMANRSKRSPVGGGILFVFGSIGGAIIGAACHQTTVGFLTGVGAAAGISFLLWLRDRSA
jgi:hypothetical protein